VEAIPETVPSWENLYPHLAPAQQHDLLALAERQGLLYAAQLPHAPGTNGCGERPRLVLSRLTSDLPPLCPAPIDLIDAELDAAQREAVARALGTPDLCLIAGLPGTGKSRVVAEIVTQAARRGERVLLLSALPSAVDRVLEQVAARDAVLAVRCLGSDERAESLAPVVQQLVFRERARQLGVQAVQQAGQQVKRCEQRVGRRREDEPKLARCRELAETARQLESQQAALSEQRSRLSDEVKREADAGPTGELATALDACAETWRATLARLADATSALEARRAARQKERDGLQVQIDEVRPFAEAKQQGRWWTSTWWRASFAGNAAQRLTELEGQRQQIDNDLSAAETEARQHAADLARAEDEHRTACAKAVAAETTRREARLDEQWEALERDHALLCEKWQMLLRELDADTPAPASLAVADVEASQARYRQHLEADEQEAAFARHWAGGITALHDSLPQRLATHANLVAATTTALGHDEHFRQAPVFDLLVLEQSHLVTESEFLQVASRARRWVLVGEPDVEAKPSRSPDRKTPEPADGHASPTAGRRKPPAPPVVRMPTAPRLFARLWGQLHCDPRQLPYVWFHEGERLGCRLRPVSPDQRQHLESEPVADFPDVELRILALPRCEPAVAEVLFPPSMSLTQAKEFIFKELQELPVRARGHSLCWREEPDRLVLSLSESDGGHSVAVPLEHGVRELVIGNDGPVNGTSIPWYTGCLEFDRSAGWQRSRAEAWVRQYLRVRDPGRTVLLDVPYRARPELAAFLSELLFANAYRLPGGCRDGTIAVEFVPVPALSMEPAGRQENGRRSNGQARSRPARGGAGLELDLADPRNRDRLPSEVRPELAETGLVNYLEAQAMVRMLEGLAGKQPAVAVLALYPSQAALIRSLVRRSSLLAQAGLDLRIGVPGDFREHECEVVLLSLTRSHSHRAVAFGDGPQALALALTRARSKLILFGDAGTLGRRSQWDGAVDHLDETAAARERALISRLLRYLNGEGAHPRVFHLHESQRS
jgi:hypothetical protein